MKMYTMEQINEITEKTEVNWISVKDALPPKIDFSEWYQSKYMVCYDDGRIAILHWCDGWNCYQDYEGNIYRENEMTGVVAWAPVPKPYLKEEDKVEKSEGTSKIEKVKSIIRKHYGQAQCGCFFSRNLAGDPMETIYSDENVTVDICRLWAYFEIFGLTKDEENAVLKFYDSLKEGSK